MLTRTITTVKTMIILMMTCTISTWKPIQQSWRKRNTSLKLSKILISNQLMFVTKIVVTTIILGKMKIRVPKSTIHKSSKWMNKCSSINQMTGRKLLMMLMLIVSTVKGSNLTMLTRTTPIIILLLLMVPQVIN